MLLCAADDKQSPEPIECEANGAEASHSRLGRNVVRHSRRRDVREGSRLHKSRAGRSRRVWFQVVEGEGGGGSLGKLAQT